MPRTPLCSTNSFVKSSESLCRINPLFSIDKIEEILLNDPELNQAYKRRIKDDKSFRESEWEQLYFIYQRSPYYEKSVNILPIYFSH